LPELLRALVSRDLEPSANFTEQLRRAFRESSRFRVLRLLEVADEARSQAEAQLQRNPDWLTDDDRSLLDAYVKWHESATNPPVDEYSGLR